MHTYVKQSKIHEIFMRIIYLNFRLAFTSEEGGIGEKGKMIE